MPNYLAFEADLDGLPSLGTRRVILWNPLSQEEVADARTTSANLISAAISAAALLDGVDAASALGVVWVENPRSDVRTFRWFGLDTPDPGPPQADLGPPARVDQGHESVAVPPPNRPKPVTDALCVDCASREVCSVRAAIRQTNAVIEVTSCSVYRRWR